jgi:hypothetical protein
MGEKGDRHGPNRFGDYEKVHDSHMQKLILEGFVLDQDLRFQHSCTGNMCRVHTQRTGIGQDDRSKLAQKFAHRAGHPRQRPPMRAVRLLLVPLEPPGRHAVEGRVASEPSYARAVRIHRVNLEVAVAIALEGQLGRRQGWRSLAGSMRGNLARCQPRSS